MESTQRNEMTKVRMPERRRHRVLVTRNTEYHLRDRTCVAVRDRRSGNFLYGHLALERRLVGAVKRVQGGGMVPTEADPSVGDALYFIADGLDLVTSPVVRVERPSPEDVAHYRT